MELPRAQISRPFMQMDRPLAFFRAPFRQAERPRCSAEVPKIHRNFPLEEKRRPFVHMNRPLEELRPLSEPSPAPPTRAPNKALRTWRGGPLARVCPLPTTKTAASRAQMRDCALCLVLWFIRIPAPTSRIAPLRRAFPCAQHLFGSGILKNGRGFLPRRGPARTNPRAARANPRAARTRRAPARQGTRGTRANGERKPQLRARNLSTPPPHSSGSPGDSSTIQPLRLSNASINCRPRSERSVFGSGSKMLAPPCRVPWKVESM